MRKVSGKGKYSFYVVSPVEIIHLKEMEKDFIANENRLKSFSKNVRNLSILSCQRWINNLFVEVVENNQRLHLSYLLQVDRLIQPSQYIINQAFAKAIQNSDLFIASMLLTADSSTLSADQTGFSAAFGIAIEQDNLVTFDWLMNGRHGFTPSQESIDEAFIFSFFREGVPTYMMNALDMRVTPAVRTQMEDERAQREAVAARRMRNELKQTVFRVGLRVDIHRYSDIRVRGAANAALDHEQEAPAAEAVGGGNRRTTLNAAILAHMTSRVPVSRMNLQAINAQLVDIVERFIPAPEQDAALRVIASVLTDESMSIFAVTLAFLQSLPPEKTHVWIAGFFSEAILVGSCVPGALERVVTGLRGVEDPELDAIFAQAEAPFLAQIFLSGTFNIFGRTSDERSMSRAANNAANLARSLVIRGAVAESSMETLTQLLREYAVDSIASFGEDPSTYVDRIDAIVEAVMDSFDTHLQVPFEEALRQQAVGMMMNVSSHPVENQVQEGDDNSSN